MYNTVTHEKYNKYKMCMSVILKLVIVLVKGQLIIYCTLSGWYD